MGDGGQQVPVALLSVPEAGQRLAVHHDRRPRRRPGAAAGEIGVAANDRHGISM
ncbi:hypothetical protein [Streptomyces hyaluromycini]|uniref:hypothetical protein n=1 Tax=Streptomyces hyaluromycini TaxID=1377993 RepID=UPI00142E335F|nr:hypothetical protein [Streptomyces hyaluromycini]